MKNIITVPAEQASSLLPPRIVFNSDGITVSVYWAKDRPKGKVAPLIRECKCCRIKFTPSDTSGYCFKCYMSIQYGRMV